MSPARGGQPGAGAGGGAGAGTGGASARRAERVLVLDGALDGARPQALSLARTLAAVDQAAREAVTGLPGRTMPLAEPLRGAALATLFVHMSQQWGTVAGPGGRAGSLALRPSDTRPGSDRVPAGILVAPARLGTLMGLSEQRTTLALEVARRAGVLVPDRESPSRLTLSPGLLVEAPGGDLAWEWLAERLAGRGACWLVTWALHEKLRAPFEPTWAKVPELMALTAYGESAVKDALKTLVREGVLAGDVRAGYQFTGEAFRGEGGARPERTMFADAPATAGGAAAPMPAPRPPLPPQMPDSPPGTPPLGDATGPQAQRTDGLPREGSPADTAGMAGDRGGSSEYRVVEQPGNPGPDEMRALAELLNRLDPAARAGLEVIVGGVVLRYPGGPPAGRER